MSMDNPQNFYFLLKLAENGVQIFISTHDYLLTHHLSLTAEYNTNQHTDMKFFCLNKDENNNISIEEGSTLASINNNPILDEFAAFYDLEQSYFNNSLKWKEHGILWKQHQIHL